MIFLFPAKYNNINEVDDNFKLEYNACVSLNINTIFFDHDLFVSEKKLKLSEKIINDKIILRSWMLKKEEYFLLYKKLNYNLINNPYQYLYCHYYPNVAQDIKNFITPINCWFYLKDVNDDLIKTIQNNIKTDILIKDFVKSEKGTDLFILKKDYIKHNLKKVINNFIELRGSLFNEGIVLKEVIKLKKYNKITNEWRIFVYNNKIISISNNSKQFLKFNKPNIEFIKRIISNIKKSNFYTIDIAETINNDWKIIEVGDAQVSGLASKQNELEFYSKLKNIINN